MKRILFAAVSLVWLVAVTGCASSSSPPGSAPLASVTATGLSAPPSSDAGQPSSDAGQPSSAAGQPSSGAGSTPCTTHACIAQDAQQSEVGTTAEDGSVITKAVCYKSTVKYSAGSDTYTVSCQMTYTDGSVWSGLVTLLMASNQVSWQPQYQVS